MSLSLPEEIGSSKLTNFLKTASSDDKYLKSNFSLRKIKCEVPTQGILLQDAITPVHQRKLCYHYDCL